MIGATVNQAIPADFRDAPRDVTRAVRQASARSGVDFAYLMAKAAAESSYRAELKATTSSATGLYQFVQGTWMEMVGRHGDKYGLGDYAAAIRANKVDPGLKREILALRNDPKMSALMAAEYTSANRAHLESRVNGKIGSTELYLAHFLGARGAERFIAAQRTNPDQAGADLLPKAAAVNRNVFYDGARKRSLGEIHQRFAAKFGGPPNPATAKRPAPVPTTSHRAAPAAYRPAPWRSGPLAYEVLMILAALKLPGETGQSI